MAQKFTTVFLAVFIYAALAPNASFAQAYVQGSVVSTGGADIPAATVVIERQGGGLDVTTTETRGDGEFNAILLAPGNYTISVSADGFKASQPAVVNFSAGRNPLIPFTLELLEPSGRASTFNRDGTARSLTIFIGPQVRDGFKDIDRNIRDSIRDIQSSLLASGKFFLVPTKEEALLKLEILARGVTGTSGSVGIPSFGGAQSMLSIKERSVVVRLTVGSYQTHLIAEAGSWSESAEEVVEHILVWTDANRQRLAEIARTQ